MEDTVFLLYEKISFSELKKEKAEHLLFTDAQLCCTHFEGVLFCSSPFLFYQAQGLNRSSFIYGALSEGALFFFLPAF